MKTYHSDLFAKPFDIVYANFGGKKHYYVCIYTQKLDPNNPLKNDIYALFITTNPKFEYLINHHNDYNVKTEINGKKAYICCDKVTRLKPEHIIQIKSIELTEIEKMQIKEKYDAFIAETKRQILTQGKE